MGKKKLQSSTKTLIASGIASLGTAIGIGAAGFETYVAEGGNPIVGLVAAAGSLVVAGLVCAGASFVYARSEKKQEQLNQQEKEVEETATLEK